MAYGEKREGVVAIARCGHFTLEGNAYGTWWAE